MAQLNVLLSDGYDREVFARALERSRALAEVNAGFGRLLPHADALTCDLFCALYKLNVVMRPEREVAPAALINRAMLDALLANGALDGLRQRTALDEVTAAAAAATLGRRLLDALRRTFRTDPAALVDAADAARTAGMLEAREAELVILEDRPPFAQAENAALADEVRAELATLRTRARRERRRQREAARAVAQMEGAVEVGIADTAGQLDGTSDGLQGLGLAAGAGVDVDRRLELGERIMRSSKLRRLARLVGAMREVAFEARRRRAVRAPQALNAITMGDDIQRLLPSEMLGIRARRRAPVRQGAEPDSGGQRVASVRRTGRVADALRVDFLRRFAERELLQFRLEAPAARGPMVICLDGSSSMQGAKELWAKAVSLTLMEIARRERRRCLAIIFSSGDALFEVELLGARRQAGRAAVRDEDVLRFAEYFPGGGTDFEAPLARALEAVTEGNYRRGDIVFISDGQASVSERLVERIGTLRKRHRFRIRAILVDVGEHADAAVRRFADDVQQVSDLASDAIADLFAAV